MANPGMFFFGAIALVAAVSYCSAHIPEPKGEVKQVASPLPPVTEEKIKAKSANVDLRPYDKATYPKAWDQIGKFIKDGSFQRLRIAAVRDTASRHDCDQVALSERSNAHSTATNPVVVTMCENGFRKYYDIDWLKQQEAAKPHLPAANSANPKERPLPGR